MLALAALAVPQVGPRRIARPADPVLPAVPAIPPGAPQPGAYRAVYRVTAIAMPGVPADVARGLQAMFAGTGQQRAFCYAPGEAADGARALALRLAQGDCRTVSAKVAKGNLQTELACREGRDLDASYRIEGTYDPAGMNVAMKVVHSGPAGTGGGQTIDFAVAAALTGPC